VAANIDLWFLSVKQK